ncbi:MAG: TetR/AcrR family transcriptional regulator C-terminal domain-containing protein [Paracoccaceae bacterium]
MIVHCTIFVRCTAGDKACQDVNEGGRLGRRFQTGRRRVCAAQQGTGAGPSLALADAEGIDALSMRRLGRALGAGAMSLYHHVRDKDALLDGMVDLVFAEIHLPESGGDWQAALRARAVSTRDVLARHPWAIALIETRTAPGPANLRHREAVTATLRKAGFSVRMATHANWLIDSYVYGYALQRANLPFADAEEAHRHDTRRVPAAASAGRVSPT